jgi:hypothetical protein
MEIKRFLTASVAAVVLILPLFASAPAKAQVPDLVTEFAISKLLGQLQQAADALTARGTRELNGSILAAADQIKLIIADLKRQYDDSMMKTVDQLSGREQEVFRDAWQLTREIFAEASEKTKDPSTMRRQLSQSLHGLPRAKRKPWVLAITPEVIFPNDDRAQIAIDGEFLYGERQGEPQPSLVLNGRFLQLIASSSGSLLFALEPAQLSEAGSKNLDVLLKLTVYHRECGFLNLSCSPYEPIRQTVGLVRLPRSIGTYAIKVSKLASDEKQRRTEGPIDLPTASTDGQEMAIGGDPICKTPDQGWFIDMDRSWTYVKARLRCKDPRESGAVYGRYANNNPWSDEKICAQLFVNPVGEYACTASGKLWWTQRPKPGNEVYEPQTVIETGELLWGKDTQTLKLPAGRDPEVRITFFDGVERNAFDPISLKWIEVKWDNKQRTLSLRPVGTDNINRLPW